MNAGPVPYSLKHGESVGVDWGVVLAVVVVLALVVDVEALVVVVTAPDVVVAGVVVAETEVVVVDEPGTELQSTVSIPEAGTAVSVTFLK